MIGKVLGGRYKLLQQVGGGGMALVYKAHDILLNRHVAVKILRQQYVHDDEFMHRFRREAQSAASLSHPNVVSIYDVGQDGDSPYIVMEYVEGMTLNDLIKEKAPLQVEEAVNIAAQICDALDHAHTNQIIHRDIKPHNILIGRNGRVKVTDFGIALAVTASSITQTGSVLGSVHYFSPEHAQGTAAGAKSDLYSLGIVLYQMLTARLPFIGESPISVALKHLQEDFEEPRKANPLIPQSVENIILKSLRKSPNDRYFSANEMLLDLETCLKPERRLEAKLLFPEDDDAEKTLILPALRGEYLSKGIDDDSGNWEDKPAAKRRGWIKPLVWTTVLLLIILALWWGVRYLQENLVVEDILVPNVEGQTLAKAEELLRSANLKVGEPIRKEFNPDVPKDVVISQNPKENGRKKPGGSVTLTVSEGIEMQTMKDYTGRPWKAVEVELIAAGYKDQFVMDDAFSDKPLDEVFEQEPKPGTSYDPTKVQIKLTYSKGVEKFPMPDLTGKTVKEAEDILAKLNLGLVAGEDGRSQRESFTQPAGRIFDQWPYKKDQTVEAGKRDIVVWVSTGIPEDAWEMPYTLPLQPAEEGKSSTFRIVVSDAKGDELLFITKEVSKTEVVIVPIMGTKTKHAVIQIFRDNINQGSRTVTYADYLKQKNEPSVTPTPRPTATPTPSPTDKPFVPMTATPTPKQSVTPTTAKTSPPSGGQ